MANFQFNVTLGREVELYNRVDSNDPANSAIILVVLAEAGLESDATLKDFDTLAAVVAGTTNEVTNTNYARKTLADTELAAYTVNDTDDQILLVLPVQTFTSISAGNAWRKLLVCYDSDTTAGTDANIIPITGHDLLINNAAVTPNGSNIVIDLSSGFVTAR